MQATDRPEFTPPADTGLLRSIALALLAHAVLVLALSWGLKWKRDQQDVAVEAELWSPTVQQAAPRPVEPTPAPPPPQVAARPPPPVRREADIAVERERERQAREQARREEARREEAERQRTAAAQKRREEEAARRQAATKQQAEERRRQEQLEARREQQDEAQRERLRREQMERIAGLAGATGSPGSRGTAAQSAGPSASYAGRLAALFQRNVVFPGGVETIMGNPEAELQVRVSPSGNILSVRLTRSSGNTEWDQAAVRAIERTGRIPPDEDGRFVMDFVVGLRPKAR